MLYSIPVHVFSAITPHVLLLLFTSYCCLSVVSKFNPITWSAKGARIPASFLENHFQDSGKDGVPPAGFRREDDENEAPHLRICGAVTGDRLVVTLFVWFILIPVR